MTKLKPWSKLQKQIYNLITKEININPFPTRQYLDTPVGKILTNKFDNDYWRLIDIL